MQKSCQPEIANQKFEWEARFYQSLSLPRTDLAERVIQAESILYDRVCKAHSLVISAAEQEALDEARQHLRKLQVRQLGYPAIAGELARQTTPMDQRNETHGVPRDLTGRPIPLSERRRLWKAHSA
jgi:hypothetical protein